MNKIFVEIDENDIRGAQQFQSPRYQQQSQELEDEDATSEEQAAMQSQLQREQAIELRFIFALADFLKVQAKNNETGLFDIAQSMYESWKAQKEQKAIKSLLKHIEREMEHDKRRMIDALKIWRLQAEIAGLQ